MLKIGCHLSASKGYKAMINDALKIGANIFQFFTRNPRGGNAKNIDEKDISEFLKIKSENNFGPILAHAPYTLNACSKDEAIRNFSINTMADDIQKMELTPNNYYNFHPGSHTGQGEEIGIKYISDMLNQIISPTQTTIVLLETMAGKGSEIGKTFQEIQQIISQTKYQDKIGVCMDTCHIFDAGYDIINKLDDTLYEFDKVIGLNKLYAIHLNDTKNPYKSHKDRHEKIGQGFIGIEAITKIINHPKLKHLPFYLETPNELEGYAEEIKLLKSIYKD